MFKTKAFLNKTGSQGPRSTIKIFCLSGLLFILSPVVINAQCDLVITDPPAVCWPMWVDLTLPAITEGSPADLTLTYWTDSTATNALISPDKVRFSGTYYIRGEATDGCFSIHPVLVTIYQMPSLVINDPEPVCEPQTVDITAPSITAGSQAGLIFTYWENLSATIALMNPSSLGSGTYYIKAGDHDCGCFVVDQVVVIVNPEIVPMFNPIGPLGQGSEAPVLPDISVNGVSGTWNPATINTDVPGVYTYTFLPDVGQCAVSLTMEIIIEAASGINEVPVNSAIQIFPNPNNGAFTLELQPSITKPIELSVLDITGKVIFTKEFTGIDHADNHDIKLPSRIPGIYFLRLLVEGDAIYRKVIVE